MAEHNIVAVGIHAPSATFPAIHLYPLLAAECEIHLGVDLLVTSENNSRGHLPHEEVFPVAMAREKFLHRQKKRQFFLLSGETFGKFNVNHDFPKVLTVCNPTKFPALFFSNIFSFSSQTEREANAPGSDAAEDVLEGVGSLDLVKPR